MNYTSTVNTRLIAARILSFCAAFDINLPHLRHGKALKDLFNPSPEVSPNLIEVIVLLDGLVSVRLSSSHGVFSDFDKNLYKRLVLT